MNDEAFLADLNESELTLAREAAENILRHYCFLLTLSDWIANFEERENEIRSFAAEYNFDQIDEVPRTVYRSLWNIVKEQQQTWEVLRERRLLQVLESAVQSSQASIHFLGSDYVTAHQMMSFLLDEISVFGPEVDGTFWFERVPIPETMRNKIAKEREAFPPALVTRISSEYRDAISWFAQRTRSHADPKQNWISKSPSEWEVIFKCCWKTIKGRIERGEIRANRIHSKCWQIRKEDLPEQG